MTERETRQELDPATNRKIGRRIAALRSHQGLSQAELGARVRCGARLVSRYERGEYPPTLEMMIRLAKGLGASLDYLVLGTPYRERQGEPRPVTERERRP